MHGTLHKKTESIIQRVLHFLEVVIAIMTLVVLVYMVGLEVYKMFTQSGYLSSLDNFLHNS